MKAGAECGIVSCEDSNISKFIWPQIFLAYYDHPDDAAQYDSKLGRTDAWAMPGFAQEKTFALSCCFLGMEESATGVLLREAFLNYHEFLFGYYRIFYLKA